jgi:hypothetical protein
MSRQPWRNAGARPLRRYPALEEYRDAYDRGEAYPAEHPISRAARFEVNAEDLYALAEGAAKSPLSRKTWLAAGNEEMAVAARILVEADRRTRVGAR